MAASKTAEYVALYRALETLEHGREPLFRDPYAGVFLSRRLSVLLRTAQIRPLHRLVSRYLDVVAPGARVVAAARTRFIDDMVRRRLAEGIGQLVVLGAGFDCRAHRLDELRAARVFEVDRSETQEAKRLHLGRASMPMHHDVRYVAADFLGDGVDEQLAAARWDATRRTLFLWEGVTNYLTEQAVLSVLRFIGRAAAGSWLVFSYVHRGLLDGTLDLEGGEWLLGKVQALSEPWTFGLYPTEVAPCLSRLGLALRENLDADECRGLYLGGAASFGGKANALFAACRVAVAEV